VEEVSAGGRSRGRSSQERARLAFRLLLGFPLFDRLLKLLLILGQRPVDASLLHFRRRRLLLLLRLLLLRWWRVAERLILLLLRGLLRGLRRATARLGLLLGAPERRWCDLLQPG